MIPFTHCRCTRDAARCLSHAETPKNYWTELAVLMMFEFSSSAGVCSIKNWPHWAPSPLFKHPLLCTHNKTLTSMTVMRVLQLVMKCFKQNIHLLQILQNTIYITIYSYAEISTFHSFTYTICRVKKNRDWIPTWKDIELRQREYHTCQNQLQQQLNPVNEFLADAVFCLEQRGPWHFALTHFLKGKNIIESISHKNFF